MYNNQVPEMNRLMWPILDLRSGQAPCVPPSCFYPQLQQYVPAIANYCAQLIQSKAQNNQIRILHFNVMAANNFQNQDFVELVTIVIDYVALCCSGNNNRPENVVPGASEEMIDLLCALNAHTIFQQYPQMLNGIQPNQVDLNDIQRCLGQLNVTRQKIQMMRNSLTQPVANNMGMPAPVWGGGGGNSLAFGMPNPNMPFANTNVLSGSQVLQNQVLQNNQPTASTSLLSAQQAPLSSTTAFGNKYSGNGTNANVQAPAVAAPVLAESSEVSTWVPSPSDPTALPYYPAFNPVTKSILLKRGPTGAIIPFIKEKERTVMDYKKHCLGTIFGDIPANFIPEAPTKALTQIAGNIGELNDALEKTNSPEGVAANATPMTYTKLIRESIIVDLSVEAAWINTILARLQVETNPMVYRSYAIILKPVIADKSYQDVIAAIGNADSYLKVRDILNRAKDTLPLSIWKAVNDRMTNAINDRVKNSLSLPGLFIVSFVEDIEELFTYIENKYGVVASEKLAEHQNTHIKSMFRKMDEKWLAENVPSLYLIDDVAPYAKNITYMNAWYSLTYLNCRSSELEIDFLKEVACMLTPELTPVLYDVAVNVFNDADVTGCDGPAKVEKHLLRTNDGYTLELTRGLLSSNCYLISLVE
jgi:hypothetical protein